jgi:hypothetical protein
LSHSISSFSQRARITILTSHEEPAAGEGAVTHTKATAMTSPQAATTGVLAAIATTEIDHGVPDIELTAVTYDTEDENMKAEPEPSSETMPQAQNNEGEVVGENPQEEQSHLEGAQDAGLPYIPDMDPTMVFGYPMVTMGGELQMPAGLDILSQFAQPYYANSVNDLGYPPVSAHGLPVVPPALEPVPQQSYLESSPYMEDLDEARISAYAKLEFEDGEFYMNTYSVVLGRDAAATKAALRRDREAAAQIEREAAGAQEPRTPIRVKLEGSHHSRSIISEQGGILREGEEPESSGERERRIQRRKASKKSKSSGSSSHPPSRRASLAQPYGVTTYQPQTIRRAVPETAGARPVDPARLRPSPHDCPLIGIHPPAAKPASDYKAISRKHVMITYNSKKKLFEAHVLGRNGAFVLGQTGNSEDDNWYGPGCVFPLTNDTSLQIGGVVVRFLLPDVIEGQTGAEQRSEYDDGYSEDSVPEMYREGGKEMSFDFNETAREGALADTSEERSTDRESEQEEEEQDDNGSENGEEDVVDEGEEEEDEDNEEIENDGRLEKSIERGELEVDIEQARGLSHDSQKKRGPGRPPKNGIMSKREQQLAKKEALAKSQQKAAKKTIPQPEGQQPVKNKVGRPRKHPRPDTPPVQREKRKYTKRKPKEPKDGEAKPNGSGGDDQPAKEKKEKKPPKPPRSPSPTFNEADLTPEQLAKPQSNYVLLIYEALMESKNDPNKNGQMSLPQIYRAIQRKYPFFVVKATTNGWQSSVRHNLSQHAAFKKVERDGKGWMWAIVDGVSVEKEKKRRPTPPPQMPPGQLHHQPIYQAGHPPHMMPGYPAYGPGMMGPPLGYPMNHQIPPQCRPGQVPQYMGSPPPMNGQPLPQGHYPMNGHPPPGFVAALVPQLTGANAPGSYSSPYAPKPTVSSPPPSHEQQASAETKPLVQNQDPSPIITPQPIQQPQHPSQPQQASQPQPPAPQVVQQAAPQPVHQEPASKPTPLPNPPKRSEPIMRAIESFRANLVQQLKNGGSTNADLLVDSAINRALGVTSESAVGNEHQEEQIVKAVSNLIASLQTPPKPSSRPATDPSSSSPQPQNQPGAQANHYGTQVNATQLPANSTSGDKPSLAVMRPSFTGQSRANGPAVPRPPMVMKRTNSGSPANPPVRSSAHPPSPAPTASPPNGASTPKHSPDENGQLAGQKRPLDDSHDPRDAKRVTS